MAPKRRLLKLDDVLEVLGHKPSAAEICSAAAALLDRDKDAVRGRCQRWDVKRYVERKDRPLSGVTCELEQKVLQAARKFLADCEELPAATEELPTSKRRRTGGA